MRNASPSKSTSCEMHKTVVETTCSAAALVVNRNSLRAGRLQGLSSMQSMEPGRPRPVRRSIKLMLRFFQLLFNFGFLATNVFQVALEKR